jgi:GTPase-activating protein SAC7
MGDSTIFGCDIETSTEHASGTIYISTDVKPETNATSTKNHDSVNVMYGKVPLVIVSCGCFLKAHALNTEGIFRLAGSNKRIKQLQLVFSTPPDYGAKIDWDGYTVHDAASLLRRYLGSLKEPLIPVELYEEFRTPLAEKEELLQYFKERDSKSWLSLKNALKNDKVRRQKIVQQRKQLLAEYALLFERLPPIQRRVLFYLLDMLAMFNLRSEKNRMPAKNLAAIFQPSILSHPMHDMNPDEYALNSLVIESMITYSHKILTKVQADRVGSTTAKVEAKSTTTATETPSSNANDQIDTVQMSERDETSVKATNDTDEMDDTLSLRTAKSSTKPTIFIDIERSNSNENAPLRSMLTTPTRGSPLKHMITPLETRNNGILFDEFEAPTTSFSSPVKSKRPYSKSVSQVGQTEVVRIPFSANSTSSSLRDDGLSRIASNQSGSGVFSLTSINENESVRDFQNDGEYRNENLMEELGLTQPDQIITSHSMANQRPIIPQIVNRYQDNVPSTAATIQDVPFTPITPVQPQIVLEHQNDSPTNSESEVKLSADHNGNETTIQPTTTPSQSSHASQVSEVSKSNTEDTGSAFSFQPSLVYTGDEAAHAKKRFELDDDDTTTANTTTTTTMTAVSATTPVVTGFVPVKMSHPDVIYDSESLHKTLTSESSDSALRKTPPIGASGSANKNLSAVKVKKRSNSASIAMKAANRTSSLFSLKKKDSGSASPDGSGEFEKSGSWFDKLKSKSSSTTPKK